MQDLDNVSVVLPAHGHPFASMNQRVDDIIEHHVERLEVLVNSAHELGRAGSVDEFMQKLFRERSWGSMAASETYAHLEHLRIRGDATTERDDSGLLFYDLSSVVAP